MERLREILIDGPQDRSWLEIIFRAPNAEKYAAANALGVIKTKKGYGQGWVWMLPEHHAKWLEDLEEERLKAEKNKREKGRIRMEKQRKAKREGLRQAKAKENSAKDRRATIPVSSPDVAESRRSEIVTESAEQEAVLRSRKEKQQESIEELSRNAPGILRLLQVTSPEVPLELAAERMRVQLQRTVDEAQLEQMERRYDRGRQRELEEDMEAAKLKAETT